VNQAKWERLGAASGFLMLLIGAAGGALERGWPSANEPAKVFAFATENRAAILAQSMLFALSAGLTMWFVATLRSFLIRAEHGTATMSTLTFGAGLVWTGMHMVAQAFQVGVAMTSKDGIPEGLLWTAAAMFSMSNLPLAVMLLATAVVVLRDGAFPAWLGWLSVVAAFAQTLLWCGTVIESGPLGPNGWLTYSLYPVFALWLLATAVVMVKMAGRLDPARRNA